MKLSLQNIREKRLLVMGIGIVVALVYWILYASPRSLSSKGIIKIQPISNIKSPNSQVTENNDGSDQSNSRQTPGGEIVAAPAEMQKLLQDTRGSRESGSGDMILLKNNSGPANPSFNQRSESEIIDSLGKAQKLPQSSGETRKSDSDDIIGLKRDKLRRHFRNYNSEDLQRSFFNLRRELRKALGRDIDQELDSFLAEGIEALELPEDILASSCYFSNMNINEIKPLVRDTISFLNHIPFHNKPAIVIGAKILDIFIELNYLLPLGRKVAEIAYMCYAESNPAFTPLDITIDDYLAKLKTIVQIFCPKGLDRLLIVKLVIDRCLGKKSTEDEYYAVSLRIELWEYYCCGCGQKPVRTPSSGQAPTLIPLEFKLLKFFLSFTDQSTLLNERIAQAERDIPQANMSEAYYTWPRGVLPPNTTGGKI